MIHLFPRQKTRMLIVLGVYLALAAFLLVIGSGNPIATCLLVGWAVKPQTVIEEITLGGTVFRREKLYVAMVKFVTPVMLLFLLLQSLGIFH